MNRRAVATSAVALLAFLPVVACGSPSESEPASESSHEALVCQMGSTLPQCRPAIPPECYAETSSCTTAPGTWAEATPQGATPATLAADQAWIAALEALKCTTPVAYDPNVTGAIGMFVTTCPVPVSELPPLPTDIYYFDGASNYGQLELGCNACFLTLPPAGSFRFAWDPSSDRPGGCKMGSCSSTH